MEPTICGRRQVAGIIWSPGNSLTVSKKSRNIPFGMTARECLEGRGHWHLSQPLVSNGSLKKCIPLRCNKINHRTTEQLGLEGSSGGHFIQPACSSRVKFSDTVLSKKNSIARKGPSILLLSSPTSEFLIKEVKARQIQNKEVLNMKALYTFLFLLLC